ncbi:MAG: inositol monophosphatase family protein [Patescibacteria group bacterium]
MLFQNVTIDLTLLEACTNASVEITNPLNLEINEKASDSKDFDQVTSADIKAQDIIFKILKIIFPSAFVIGEESDFQDIPDVDGLIFTIDPIDGTKEFIRGGNEVSIMIAAIFKQKVIASIIYNPFSGEYIQLKAEDGKVYRNRANVLSKVEFKLPDRKFGLLSNDFFAQPQIAKLSYIAGGDKAFFKNHTIISGSYGTSVARLITSQISTYITKPNKINPWDEVPSIGMLIALGFKYYVLDEDQGIWKEYEPFFSLIPYRRNSWVLITKPEVFALMSEHYS